MNTFAGNMKINHLFRDAGNYKKNGFEMISNPDGIDPDPFASKLKEHFIDEIFFYSERCGKKNITECSESRMWHELDTIQYTSEKPTVKGSADEFLKAVNKMQKGTPVSGV